MAREAAAVVVAEDVEVAVVSAVTDAVEAMEEAAVAMAVENDEDTVVVAAVEVAVMEIEMEVAKVVAVDTGTYSLLILVNWHLSCCNRASEYCTANQWGSE